MVVRATMALVIVVVAVGEVAATVVVASVATSSATADIATKYPNARNRRVSSIRVQSTELISQLCLVKVRFFSVYLR